MKKTKLGRNKLHSAEDIPTVHWRDGNPAYDDSFIVTKLNDQSHASADAEWQVAERTLGQRYRLLERIGRGGMGSVWRAEQLVPVKRVVAIKFLRHDSISQNSLARFATEQQSLAAMDHPHIAKVLDGASSGDSVPFLVMEYVQGLPLNEHCDTFRMSLRTRLRLFVAVCAAVEHAHQQGIVHRDLKPSNVLVAHNNAGHVPKVIDFGLAKALPWSELAESDDQRTASGEAIGTLLYMAPEQVANRRDSVDTRADVYALGVILYELATGNLPFQMCSHKDGGWVETARQIMHEEPTRPSARLASSTQRAFIATSHGTSDRSLIQMIQGDLDLIILKSVAKAPSDRYESVSAMRRDVENFLNNRPIVARSSSHLYLARKFLQRHWALSLLSAMTIAITVVGLSVATWGLLCARDAERRARVALDNERQANERTRRAFATLLNAITGLAMRDSGSSEELLSEIVALHDLASDENGYHADEVQSIDVDFRDDLTRKLLVYQQSLHLLSHLQDADSFIEFEALMLTVRIDLAHTLAAAGREMDAAEEYSRCEAMLERLSSNPSTPRNVQEWIGPLNARLENRQCRHTENGSNNHRRAELSPTPSLPDRKTPNLGDTQTR